MKVVRETCVAGKVIDVTIKVPSGNHSGKRAAKTRVTSEKVEKNNERIAEKELARLFNANFTSKDAHVVLTYKEKPTQKQAAAALKKILRKLRSEFKKQGKTLKYIAVTEYIGKRIHHHIVINTQDTTMLVRLWEEGYVNMKALDESGDYTKLAKYFIKESRHTFRYEESQHKRRYSCSRNLTRPVVKREMVSEKQLWEDPKPIQGYYIPKDSVRRYEHPITELEHLEYRMIAIDEPRAYGVWPRGKKVSGKENFKVNYREEQEAFMTDDIQAILKCGKESE
jgi:hypothetical protein